MSECSELIICGWFLLIILAFCCKINLLLNKKKLNEEISYMLVDFHKSHISSLKFFFWSSSAFDVDWRLSVPPLQLRWSTSWPSPSTAPDRPSSPRSSSRSSPELLPCKSPPPAQFSTSSFYFTLYHARLFKFPKAVTLSPLWPNLLLLLALRWTQELRLWFWQEVTT